MTPEPDTSTTPPALPSVPAATGAVPPPAQPAAPALSAGQNASHPPPPRHALQPAVVVGWMLGVVALTVAVLLWQKVNGMQEVLARQNADTASQSAEARALARQADEAVRNNAAKLAALDARIADMSAYRAQLEELAQSASRVRDENLAVDLETALRLAQDQTQLTGSTEPLLAALRTAERRLGRSQDPRLAPVARAVSRDLERVKAATVTDTAGLLGRIDQLLRQTDDLPVANEVGRPSGVARTRELNHPEASSWWGRLWADIRNEAEGLLRVSRVERPEASMLSPEQAFFVRENLKLRLQGARLGILARQYEAARNDLAAASVALGTWFDPASRRTQAAATLLQQVQAQSKSAALPRAEESLIALGNAVAATTPGRSN